MNILLFLLIGCVAGWLAGQIVKGHGFGMIGNVIVGVIGAFIGGYLFSLFGATAGGGLLGSLVTAVIGSVVLLLIVGFIRKR